jgi:hypothetical protein
MSDAATRRSSLAAAFVVVLAAACSRHGARDAAPFEGARPVELASAAVGREPSRADLERLVAALVDVAGGAARLSKLNYSRREDLYLKETGDPQSKHVVATTSSRADQTVKTVLEYASGEGEQRVMLRRDCRLLPRMAKRSVAAAGARQQHVEWDWEVARLPQLLLEAESLTPLPTRVDEGHTLVGMRVAVTGVHPEFEAWVDLAGPMIVELRAELPITSDLVLRGKAEQVQRLSDYRRVKGLLFPFRRDVSVDGQRFLLAEAREVTLDVDLPDSFFQFGDEEH